jgi:hypothetical protein
MAMRDKPIAVALLEAQQQATEVSCSMCRGRGQVVAAPTRGQWLVRVEHGRLCPRRPRLEPSG